MIIAYKRLRELEIGILKELKVMQGSLGSGNLAIGNEYLSSISLTQFYGIEIDDFAHEIAMLSLWLAEHQMNVVFKAEFGQAKPTLPLKEAGNIVCGNATRLDWEEVCSKEEGDEVYVLGNPPYRGARVQKKEHKADLAHVFKGVKKYKDLDYIACWFYKGGKYIQNSNSKLSFVSTNSICQGEQVVLLWPHVFELGVKIEFGHQSFKWTNNAKGNAGVIVVIIGLASNPKEIKSLYKHSVRHDVSEINAYLVNGSNTIVKARSKPLSNFPRMCFGNMPNDGGGLIMNEKEKKVLINESPDAIRFIRNLIGSNEFIKGTTRYCLWIEDQDLDFALQSKFIRDRIEATKRHRLNSKDTGTNALAKRSHQFRDLNTSSVSPIIVPTVSSERREYIPIGYLSKDSIISNLAFAVYKPEPFLLGILTSEMHMNWIRAVGGRLEARIRYSNSLCYNTFPFPPISKQRKEEVTQCVFRILDERERYSERTLAQLYDPDKMPAGLREAHCENDRAVERCYRNRPFVSDEDRLEYLFRLYEKMIAEEKEKNTLFEKPKKTRKKA